MARLSDAILRHYAYSQLAYLFETGKPIQTVKSTADEARPTPPADQLEYAARLRKMAEEALTQ